MPQEPRLSLSQPLRRKEQERPVKYALVFCGIHGRYPKDIKLNGF